jgi:hypothetical protein
MQSGPFNFIYKIVGGFRVCSFQKEGGGGDDRGKWVGKKDVGISTAQTDFSSVWLTSSGQKHGRTRIHPKYSFCWCKIPNRAMDILYILLIKKERMAHITSTLFFSLFKIEYHDFCALQKNEKGCKLNHFQSISTMHQQ